MSLPAQAVASADEPAWLDQGVPGVDALQIRKQYGAERAKRLRDDGNRQFVDISLSEDFKHFQDDPWVDETVINDLGSLLAGSSIQLVVLGAGFGGLLYAVRAVQAGLHPSQIRIVDTAGGFGGTWYWNRYPGLSCDIESYCYLPLLEETGYIPKHRYAHGDEIREYAERIAERWGLVDSAVFKTKAENLIWNDDANAWSIELKQQRTTDSPTQTVTVMARFVAMANGVLNWPKLPGLPGIFDFEGSIFHSSRWNYDITGGSQSDPTLTNLKDKRVAVVGTGASAVQIIPSLAKWSQHLYVVQRTPSSIDKRHQRQTDPAWYKENVASSPGWQRGRCRNFHSFFSTGTLPTINLVNDQWTRAQGMVAIAGNPEGPQSMEEIPPYMEKLHSIDLPRQSRIREQIREAVRDPAVAEKLLPWYPTWCKRPCFSDDYLSSFNRDNVTLLDTDGKGLERLTSGGIVIDGREYPIDIIIFATGYRAPFSGTPAEKGNLKIYGIDGVSMSEAWAKQGPTTLHGVLDHNFPNLFLSGPWQAALSGNNTFNTDMLSKHMGYILSTALAKAGSKPFTIKASKEATDDWGMQILKRSFLNAANAGCTPNYFNLEGDLDKIPAEAQMQIAKSGLWGKGVEDFSDYIEAWREEGSMKGVEIRIRD